MDCRLPLPDKYMRGRFYVRLLVFLLFLWLLLVLFLLSPPGQRFAAVISGLSPAQTVTNNTDTDVVSAHKADQAEVNKADETNQAEAQPQTALSAPAATQFPPLKQPQPPLQLLAAFPGAQGDGATSKGGRGGKVLVVDRLDDPCPTLACTTEDLADPAKTTPGTLRWALLQPYPRTVVFRVSGIIRLQEDHVVQQGGQVQVRRQAGITVRSPYLTVAGQSAPAGGITIANNGIAIATHDVVLRYLRFRTGRGNNRVFPNQQNPETLMIINGAERVIVDHCSLSWMPAEGLSVYTGELWDGSKGTAKDITVSWSLIGEGLVQHQDGRGHPSGAFMSGFEGRARYAAKNITLHHNLLLHTQKRNGDLLTHSGRLINNLFYNWQWLPTVLAGAVQADVIGNVWKPGPLSNTGAGEKVGIYLVPAAQDINEEDPDGWWYAVPGEPSLFLEGNAVGQGSAVLTQQTDLLCDYRQRTEPCRPFFRWDWLRPAALMSSAHPVYIDSAEQAETKVLEQVGASRRINFQGEWVSNRDTVDERFIAEYRNAIYMRPQFPWHEREVGGYPLQLQGMPYPDADRDGMADGWEREQGLDPADASDAQQRLRAGGYTHLERFLNGLD